MAVAMKYGAYVAEVEYDEDNDIFHGRTLNVRDVITFEGKSTTELRREFARSVAVYVKDCEAYGVEPERP